MSTLIQIASSGSSSGRFGIADSNGAYTYYTTLQAAITAASAGQTVEFFTDYTETGAVTITLKNGVNINGNGHTYTLSIANTIHAFEIANSILNFEVNFLNTIIKRTNSTTSAGACLLIGSNSEGRINFEGSTLINTGSGNGISPLSGNANVQIYNATVFTNSGVGISSGSNSIYNKIVNCNVYSTSNTAIQVGSFCDVIGCIGESLSASGISASGSNVLNSIGKSDSGSGIISTGGTISNCSGLSRAGYGGQGYNAGNFYNCTFLSSGSVGLYLSNDEAFKIKDCNVFSASNIGLFFNGAISAHKIDVFDTTSSSSANYSYSSGNGSITLFNCNGESLASGCVSAQNSIYSGVFQSKWNNASGHAVVINSLSQFDISNAVLLVANASANCIYSASATTIKFAQNSFKGATTPINANITQGMINTDDAYGNITI